MKKRYIGIVLAAMMMAQPVMAQGAVNPSPNTKPVVTPSKDRDDSNSSSKPLDTTGSAGAGITGAATGSGGLAGGTATGGTAGGGSGSAGNSITVGNMEIRFASNDEMKESFSQNVVETINTINSGTTPLYRAIGTPETVGYNPLIPVQTLVMTDAATQTKVDEKVTVSLYVPNLVEGLNDVQLLYYNTVTKKWEFMAPAAIDYATKQVTVTLGSDTAFTVVYRNK
ncbi:hypothetical protein [uncultured Clostridium sp.]|uniref:hypothetical protein n=1 Tax=uncultured Clostridium sp. TaxID=59620 RepID=UPI0025D2CB83|nr:hypothetical protein [uncultured Clostridium sp.]